jgi:hypothetical protein
METKMNFDLKKHTILLSICGSRAYGTFTDTSDIDVKGVAIPPKEYIFGIQKFEQAEGTDNMNVFLDCFGESEKEIIRKTKLEGSIYDVRKFIKLATESNPNIFDVLFSRDEEIVCENLMGAKLRDNAKLFLSAKAYWSFAGYSASQMKRIKLHRRYLLNPPTHKPTRQEFGLTDNPDIPTEQREAAFSIVRKQMDSWQFDFNMLQETDRLHITSQIENYLSDILITQDKSWISAARITGFSDNVIELLDKERRYHSSMSEYKSYETWKTNRNPERAALEAKFGFDTKHGMQLFRLLKQCREILETGECNVWRGGIDAEELLAIRYGSKSYDELVEWSEKEARDLLAVYKSGKYAVPKSPDENKINTLCQELIEESLRLN